MLLFDSANVVHLNLVLYLSLCFIFRVRDSTYSRLQKIARESSSPESLSSKLQESLKSDPLFPILTKPHLIALDRRLGILLDEIKKCIDVNGVKTVIIKDEF